MLRRRRLSVVFAVWTLAIWATRVRNAWGDDDLSTASKAGATALALTFVVLAAVLLVALGRRWPIRRSFAVLVALAGWTVAVWAVRVVDIAGGGHSAAFVAVHVALAVGSVVLAALALREAGPARDLSAEGPRRERA